MSGEETYKLAHTARCRLSMAADKPDRNLRFILGHALTLDKLLVRIMEIENEGNSDDDEQVPEEQDLPTSTAQRVSFSSSRAKPVGISPVRKKSPSPPSLPLEDDEDEEEYADEEEEDDEGGLGLRRFESATAKPPRMIEDVAGGDEDEDEPKSPPLTQSELKVITEGPDNGELTELYGSVRQCPCHGNGDHSPDIVKAWDIPQKDGQHGKRMAVVQVAA